MRLTNPPENYDATDQARTRRQIEDADLFNLKRNQDIEMGTARIILTSPNGSRYAITVDNAGVLGTSAV